MGEHVFLRLDRLSRAFGTESAVRALSLEVGAEEIVTLLGPSGCGKTTTLRLVAGFETPDSGRIVLEGRDVTAVPPQRRGFGMVFQHYALFPHLTVGANVAFGLESKRVAQPEVSERVGRALELVRLPGTEDRPISSLSGGQQQRVALARALAPEPRVLLLDEPLSNLDAALRERTRRELRELLKDLGITTIYVTHDQEEAFDLSDRIAVMRAGQLDQVGRAEDLYHRPATAFVATFLGRAGAVPAVVEAVRGEIADCRVDAGASWTARVPAGLRLEPGAAVTILARPEALAFAGPEDGGAVGGTISARRFAGSTYVYSVSLDADRAAELEVLAGPEAASVGATARVRPRSAPDGLHAFPKLPGAEIGGPGGA